MLGEIPEKRILQLPEYIPNYNLPISSGFVINNPKSDKETTSEKLPVSAALRMQYLHNNTSNIEAHITISNGALQIISPIQSQQMPPVIILTLRTRENAIDLARRFGDIDNIGGQERIIDFLRILEPDLKGLSIAVLGNMPIIHANVGLSRKIPIAYTGDGLTRLLSMILSIVACKDGIVLIDEIESGIYYSKLPLIWKAISKAAKEFNCQIISTTHSYECMQAITEGLEDDEKDDFLYVRLDKKDEAISAKNYPYPLFESAILNNWEIR